MVARDGIEPPTPAFSGLLTDSAKRFRMFVSVGGQTELRSFNLRTIWDRLGYFRLFNVPVLFPSFTA
jgi:hypothetical protein